VGTRPGAICGFANRNDRVPTTAIKKRSVDDERASVCRPLGASGICEGLAVAIVDEWYGLLLMNVCFDHRGGGRENGGGFFLPSVLPFFFGFPKSIKCTFLTLNLP
jgi:hypothetical protein